MKQHVDTFFGLVDKHFALVLGGIGLAVLVKTIRGATPDDDELKEVQEEKAFQNVNERMVAPAVPAKDKDGNIPKAAEIAYNVKVKAHRSAVLAQKLLDAFYGFGTDEATVLKCALDASIYRITFAQLNADYMAVQKVGFGGKSYRTPLVDDLKVELSSADYLEFMRRIGLSVEQAYRLANPTKKK